MTVTLQGATQHCTVAYLRLLVGQGTACALQNLWPAYYIHIRIHPVQLFREVAQHDVSQGVRISKCHVHTAAYLEAAAPCSRAAQSGRAVSCWAASGPTAVDVVTRVFAYVSLSAWMSVLHGQRRIREVCSSTGSARTTRSGPGRPALNKSPPSLHTEHLLTPLFTNTNRTHHH